MTATRIDAERLARALASKKVSAWMGLIAKASRGKWDKRLGERLADGFAHDLAVDLAEAYNDEPGQGEDDGSTQSVETIIEFVNAPSVTVTAA